jgi:hypothetical protein
LPSRQQNALALRENREAQTQLDALLLGCFTVQRIYGKEPDSLVAVNQVFHNVLGGLPGEQVVRAFQLWMQRSQEFPTPADIVGIVKRKGRPPLKECDIIAIRKKDGQDRTREEWAMLREWEDQQSETFSEFADQPADEGKLQENVRLRQEIASLRREIERLTHLLGEARRAKGLEKPQPSVMERVTRTVEEMRRSGASEADVELFQSEYGSAA